MDIGGTIRVIRKRKQLTIPQVAEGTGLSKGFLSNVENNKTSPSIETLHSIARFLNVPLTYLLLEKEQRMRIVRKGERQYTTFGKDNLKIEHLTSKGGLRMSIVEFPIGAETGDKQTGHEGEEWHLVLSGKVFAQQGEDTAIMEEGDTFGWNASVPHYVKNIGDESALVLIALYTEMELDHVL